MLPDPTFTASLNVNTILLLTAIESAKFFGVVESSNGLMLSTVSKLNFFKSVIPENLFPALS